MQLLYLLRQKDTASQQENFHLLLVVVYHLVGLGGPPTPASGEWEAVVGWLGMQQQGIADMPHELVSWSAIQLYLPCTAGAPRDDGGQAADAVRTIQVRRLGSVLSLPKWGMQAYSE